MSAVGVVVNAGAVGLARDPALEGRLRALTSRVAVTSHPSEVKHVIAEFHRQGVGLVGICGGDGTVLEVLSSVIPTYGAALPDIGVLRGGTINTLAKYLGITGRPDRVLRRVLDRTHGGGARKKRLAVIRVDDRHGLTFGAVMMGRFYNEYNRLERITPATVTRYVARVALSALFNTRRARCLLEPVRANIHVDGELLPLNALTVVVASCMEGHGFGVKPTYRGSSLDGRFQLVASGKGREEIIRHGHRLLLGRAFSGANHFDGMVEQARLSFARPELCMLDGEVFTARDVELAIGPAFDFVLP